MRGGPKVFGSAAAGRRFGHDRPFDSLLTFRCRRNIGSGRTECGSAAADDRRIDREKGMRSDRGQHQPQPGHPGGVLRERIQDESLTVRRRSKSLTG